MISIRQIADGYVEQTAQLDPVTATSAGIADYDHLITDLSPAGFAARAALDRATLTALEQVAAAEEEQAAKESMIERLTVAGELYDSGAVTSDLMWSPAGCRAYARSST